MDKIISDVGIALNAQCNIDSIQGIFGLILESWGPSKRNADYNAAFEVILSRLKTLNFEYISVNVISEPLMKAFPEFQERAIILDDSDKIFLKHFSAHNLRLEIGRLQAGLKINPETQGGNRTKRILMHNPNIDYETWLKIVKGNISACSKKALFLNGVYASVLETIVKSQEQGQEKNFLQPYSQYKIKLLKDNFSHGENPIILYISTTDNLNKISYQAEIIEWHDKQKLSAEELRIFNMHIAQHQPGETEIYLSREYNGKTVPCKNLLRIRNLTEISAFPISKLIKVSDGQPLQNRTQSGGWSEVHQIALMDKDEFDKNEEWELGKSEKRSSRQRLDRISTAEKKAKKIIVTNQTYIRNQDVVAEVKFKANGICGLCNCAAPFKKTNGEPFLEVHHWIPLAEGGEDTLENAVALCPNCHRRAHSGQDRDYIATQRKLRE